MRKPQLWIGVALFGVFAAVLGFLFQVAGAPDVPDAPPREVAEEPPPVESPTVETPAPSREVAEAAPIEAPSEGPPPAYAKHLGGVIGRIVDTDGTPVPGMRLDALTITIEEIFPQLDSMFADAPIDFQEVKATTRTKDDGTFRFEKLEPRAIYVLGIDPNGPRATIRLVDKPPNSGEVVDLGDIKLDAYVTFTGRVADEQGTPIAGARVRASNLPAIVFNFGVQDLKPGFSVAFQEEFRGSEDWRVAKVPSWAFRLLEKVPFPTTLSADDGSFRLEGVPIGQVTLLVDQRDFVSLTKSGIPSGNGGEKNVGTLTLTAGETLVGTVVDGSGLPVADAEVLAGPIQDLAPVALMVPAGKTDAAGRFTAKGMRDSDHAVAARSKTGVEWTLVRDVMPGYDEPQIVLANTYQVEVRAFASSGDAIAKPQLVVQKINELPLHPLLVPPIPLAGRLSYTEDGAAIVSDLAAGKYSILVRGPGHAAAQLEADLTQGSTQVAAQLEAEFTTKVTVVERGSGAPVHWATVGLFSDDRSRERRDTRAIPLANKRTDERGEAALNGLEKGKYKLVVLHPAFAETFADVEVPGADVRIELPAGGSLRGRVHEAGAPPDPDRFVGMGKNGEGFPRFNVTGEDGEFRITHLSPGDYTVAVVRRFANQGIGELAGSAQNMIPERFVPVTIVEGEETVVDIDLKGLDSDLPKARLSGRVRMNGGPAANMSLRYNANAPQSLGTDGGSGRRNPGEFMSRMKNTVTDATGFFDFGEVVAGDGRIDVQQPGQTSQFNFGRVTRVKVTLEPNESEEITIDLKVGRVLGRVVDARTGQPLGTAEVGLRPAPKKDAKPDSSPFGDWNAEMRMDTATDRDGSFAFECVPAGDYELSVRRNEYAPQRVRGIVVPENGQPPAIDVKLQTGVVAKGKVVVPPPAEGEDASNRRFAFINFRGQDESTGNGGARVDVETMQFEVDDLMPGRYQVTCWFGGENLAPVEVIIPEQGAENLLLTFEKAKPPEPPKPAGG